MQTRVKIALAALFVVVLGLIAWENLGEREPTYRGKSLSYWLELSGRGVGGGEAEAEVAVRHIGTNAIPTLLRLIQANDSPIKRKMAVLASRLSVIDFHFTTADTQWTHAYNGFHVLGEDAKGSVPALIELYNRRDSPDLQERVADVLGNIGTVAKAAVPCLIHGLTDTNDNVRAGAAMALWRIHSEPELVVPALIKALSDLCQSVQSDAIEGLASFGTNARPAIPFW